MDDFKDRLLKAMNDKRISAAELSARSGVGQSDISNYLKGKYKAKSDKAYLLAQALEVDPGWLMCLNDDATQTVPGIIPITTIKVPLLGDIACGTPSEPCQEFDCYVTAGTDVRADYALRAHGDSMIGARIHDGDIVFIRSQPTVDDGEIAAVMVDGETTLKRIRHVAGQLLLLPENPAYSPIIAASGQDVRILGKAIAFQSDVR